MEGSGVMDNNEAWRNRQTVDAHYKQQLADVEAELARTKKALEIAKGALEPFSKLYQEFVTSRVRGLATNDDDSVYGLNFTHVTRGDLKQADRAIALIRKELGE